MTERVSDKYIADILAHSSCKVLIGDRELRSILTELQSLRSAASVGVREAIDEVVKWNEEEGDPADTLHYGRSLIERLRSALSAVPETLHPDDLAVDRFAVAMKAKLAKKRDEGRGGWDDKAECSADFLSSLLRDHVRKGDPLDVGNLAMMLHQRAETITPETEGVGEPVAGTISA